MGKGWIELERALPYDMRVKWEVGVLPVYCLCTAWHRLFSLGWQLTLPCRLFCLPSLACTRCTGRPCHPIRPRPAILLRLLLPRRSPCCTSLCPPCSTAAWRASQWSSSGVSCSAS